MLPRLPISLLHQSTQSLKKEAQLLDLHLNQAIKAMPAIIHIKLSSGLSI
jgi:hypothetical protein